MAFFAQRLGPDMDLKVGRMRTALCKSVLLCRQINHCHPAVKYKGTQRVINRHLPVCTDEAWLCNASAGGDGGAVWRLRVR